MQIQVEEKEDDTEESSSKWGWTQLRYVSCGIAVNLRDSSSYLVGICNSIQTQEHMWMTFSGLTRVIKSIRLTLHLRVHSIGKHTFHPIYKLLIIKWMVVQKNLLYLFLCYFRCPKMFSLRLNLLQYNRLAFLTKVIRLFKKKWINLFFWIHEYFV